MLSGCLGYFSIRATSYRTCKLLEHFQLENRKYQPFATNINTFYKFTETESTETCFEVFFCNLKTELHCSRNLQPIFPSNLHTFCFQKNRGIHCSRHHIHVLPHRWSQDSVGLRAGNGLFQSALLQFRDTDHYRIGRFRAEEVHLLQKESMSKNSETGTIVYLFHIAFI